MGQSQTLKHDSFIPIALIGVNIWYLKFYFCGVSTAWRGPPLPVHLLPLSSRIWTLSRGKGGNFSPCSTFKIVQLKSKKKRERGLNSAECTANETFRATTGKRSAIKTAAAEENILPPCTGESRFISPICSVLSSCPPPPRPSFSSVPSDDANLGQVTRGWHRHYAPSMAGREQGDKRWWIGTYSICIVFYFPLCSRGWWMATPAPCTSQRFCPPACLSNNSPFMMLNTMIPPSVLLL